MTPNQIKGHIYLKGYDSIEDFADSINERRDAVSQVINYLRTNQRIRRKIERKLGIHFDRSIKVGANSQRRAA